VRARAEGGQERAHALGAHVVAAHLGL
jgi:hypothetical protein